MKARKSVADTTKLLHYADIEDFLDWFDNGLFLPNRYNFSQSELDLKGAVSSNLFFKAFTMDAELQWCHWDNFVQGAGAVIETTVGLLDSWFSKRIDTDRGDGHCTHGRMNYLKKSDEIEAVKKMTSLELMMCLQKCFCVEKEYRVVVEVPQVPPDDEDTDHVRVSKNLTGLFHTAYVHPTSKIPEVEKRLLESGVGGVKVLEAKLK